MKTIIIKEKKKLITTEHKLEVYENIKDMPIDIFSEYNHQVLLESNIGSDITSVDQRFGAMYEFLNKDMVKEAKDEILNLRQSMHNVFNGVNIKALSFAVRIKSIDGNEVEPNKQSWLEVIDKISGWGFSQKQLEEEQESFAKK